MLCHGGAAFCGAVVFAYVAAPWLSFPISLWGGPWLLSHPVASFIIGGVGLGVTGVCGTLSSINADQIRKCEAVRTEHVRVTKARNQLLFWLVTNLIGKDQLAQLDLRERLEIYKKTAIQVDLIEEPNYAPAGLKTTWDEFSDATQQYLQKCNDLAGLLE
ncbi:hypothetical protein BJX64DRAFT_288885 [Aspergillus heterothallicus]